MREEGGAGSANIAHVMVHSKFLKSGCGQKRGTLKFGLPPGAEAPKRPGPVHRVPAHTFLFWAGFEARCTIYIH